MSNKNINFIRAANLERRGYLTVLAVVPNAREVGVAILDLGGLVHYAVLGIRKHPTPEGREAAFRHKVKLILDHFTQIGLLAVAEPNRFQENIPLMESEREWLRNEADKRGLSYAYCDLSEAKKWCAGDRVKPTTRQLASLLSEEYPALGRVVPAPDDRLDRYRFQYWGKVFSAVALAKYILEKTVSTYEE